MINVLANFFTSFVLGLLTPLTAVCVLPLYPGFIAYLSNNMSGQEANRRSPIALGLMVTLGVVLFMLLLGIIFTTILQVSLTNVVGIISPIAFGILVIISLVLIFNVDIGKFMPKFNSPIAKNPLLSAFFFGFFFGAIVLPCNPAFIAAMFTKSVTGLNFFTNTLNFLFFGVGMATPLLVLSAISSTSSKTIIGFLTRHQRIINLVSGLLMLVISLYYLIFVFRVFGG